MSDLRSSILGNARIAREPLTVNGAAVEIRGLTAGARGRLLNAARNADGTLDFERYFAQLVIESTYDPESGAQIFQPADLDAVNALPSGDVEAIADVAQRLSGIGAESDALGNVSATTASVATSSDSPSA